jgi:hypothetical protein
MGEWIFWQVLINVKLYLKVVFNILFDRIYATIYGVCLILKSINYLQFG